MRGYKADAEKAALNGQIAILKQRLALATEQQAAAEREAENFRKELDELKEKLAHNAAPNEIAIATTNLDVLLGRLLTANNATTATLTFSGTRGLPIVPRRGDTD